MAKTKTGATRKKKDSDSLGLGCCRIDALVTVDGRGQLVLPKELRKKAGIEAGDKLAVISWGRGDEVSCISLMKADEFAGTVREILGPMMQDILG